MSTEVVVTIALITFGAGIAGGIVYTEMLAYQERKRERAYRARYRSRRVYK
jgi:hypothetical protein